MCLKTRGLAMGGVVAALLFALSGAHATAAPAPSDTVAAQAEAKLDRMRATFSATMTAYVKSTDDLARTRARIASHEARVQVLDTAIARNRARLAAEVSFLYRTGGVGVAEILLGSTSIEQFLNRSAALRRVTSRDATTVGLLAEEKAEKRAIFADLLVREKRQAELVTRLAEQRRAAQSALSQQQRYVDSLPSDVTAELDARQSARNLVKSETRKAVPAGTVVRATVTGRAGTFAVLSGQPTRYEPTDVTFDGVATWYGNVRANMRTASGRPFDENEFTCAHKTLPFGTRIAVTFRGKSVIVTVTDRGPYGQGRVVDLTKRAADTIGLKSAGVGSVHCEVVTPAR